MENKKRLIYADDIVKVAEHAFNEWNLAMAAADGDREINHVFKMQELCKAVKAVAENAPTVDAVEVAHGYWHVDDYDSGEPDGYAAFIEVHCSECGYELGAESGQYDWLYGEPFPLNYCPNCGAKMDGGET